MNPERNTAMIKMKRFANTPGARLMWRRWLPATSVSLCILVMATSGCGPAKPDAKILARIGNTVITEKEFLSELAYRIQENRPIASPEALLDEMVLRKQTLLRAHKAGLEQNPEIRRELDNLLVARLRDQEMKDRLEAVAVTDEELQAEYDRNLSKYTKPAKSRLAILFLEAPAHMSDARRQELQARMAEGRRKAMEQPTPTGRGPAAQGFGALAIEFSDDQVSRYRGGDIGWLDHGSFEYRWPRKVLETGYALDKGEISDWIEADHGYYLVSRTDFRDAATLPFEQVKPSLRNKLMAAKRKEAEEAFRFKTAGMFPADIDTNALAAIDLSTVSPAGGKLIENVSASFGPGNNLSAHAN